MIARSLADPAICRWTLRAARAHTFLPDEPIPATVPGCVHTDLLAAGLIDDPLFDTNEDVVAWVAHLDWVYSTVFVATAEMCGHDRIDLVCDGLDTLATVSLNDTVIARTANMHRSYRFDVTPLVQRGENALTVTFESATRDAEARRLADDSWPAASFGRPYNHIRKMACSWGWDWGPRLTTAGIWKDIRLESWSGARIAAVRPRAELTGDDRGCLSAGIDVEWAGVDSGGATLSVAVEDSSGAVIASGAAGANSETVDISVDAGTVAAWWPHTHGRQPLYRLHVSLVCGDDVVDTWTRRIGFRNVELDTAADATGSAFTFVANGQPIFARGVNWIPDDPFPARTTPERIRELLALAVAANTNLVRVWGGGLYESEAFYDACDELGLLVWQDFCFACAAYPEHQLAGEVEAEATEHVARLMPHPSLALWNGNNENIWGWTDWGWQDRLGDRPWGAGFYFELLPRIVATIDPSRPYWPGSPYSGSMAVAPNADAHGCVHVWDVWNQLDFDRYRDHTPRFVAEFGWQAPPAWGTLAAAVAADPITRDSPGLRQHQKADRGDAKLARGLLAHFGEPSTFDQWWWATQLAQARAVTTGVEHFRSLRGTCMGTIWWQLNDCWPAISWSLIDSQAQPKPAWYALRDAYRPRLLTIQPRGDRLVLFAVNDGQQAWVVEGTARRVAFDGQVHADQIISVVVDAGSIGSVTLDDAVARPGRRLAEVVVVGAGGDRTMWWFGADKDLALDPPRLSISTRETTDGVAVDVTAHNVVRDFTLLPDRLVAGTRSDRQLITMLPGESCSVAVRGTGGEIDLASYPAWVSAYDAISGPRSSATASP